MDSKEYKQLMGDSFKKYASSNSNKNDTERDIQDSIGYLKQVLTGERRKKVDGGYWNWESRIKKAQDIMSYLTGYKLEKHEIDALKEMFDLTFHQNYLSMRLKKQEITSPMLGRAKNIYFTIDNYLDLYDKVKDVQPEKNPSQPADNHKSLDSVVSVESESAGIKNRREGKSRLAILAVTAAMIASFATGWGLKGCYDNRIYKPQAKIEQIVKQEEKEDYSLSNLSRQEIENTFYEAKAESKTEAKPEYKVEKIAKKDDKGVTGNRGYLKKDGKWTQEKKGLTMRKRHKRALMNEQARDIKESTMLLWHEDVRKHPRANDKYNHVKGKHAYYYASKNLANTLDYVLGDGPDIKQNLFGDEQPIVSKNYEVSLMEALVTGDNENDRVDGFLSDLTSIGSKHKATPSQVIKKTGEDAKQILPSAGRFFKNFFTLNWFGRRAENGQREPGAIENLIDTPLYAAKTVLDVASTPLQFVPIVDVNGLVEDGYHSIRAVRGTAGSAAATILNFSQGTIDGVLVKPSEKIIPPIGKALDNTNIFIHDAAQFGTTGLSQLFEAEFLAENINPRKDITAWSLDPKKADGAIYPYRMPSGMRRLYEIWKNIMAGMFMKSTVSAKSESSEGPVTGNEPGRSGGAPVSEAGRSGGAGVP